MLRLFGEDPSRYIITTKIRKIVKLATQKNITIQKVGKSEGDLFKISNEFEISVKNL